MLESGDGRNQKCACVGVRTCLTCEGNQKFDILYPIQKSCAEYYYNNASKCAELKDNNKDINCKYPSRFQFPGVIIVENFLTQAEEASLINSIDKNPWKPSQSGRRKQDYGPKVNFKKKKYKISTFAGLPSYSKSIVRKLLSIKGLEDFKTVELCNLEYVPERGSSIDPHFDDSWLWGERLVSLNVLSNTWLTMTWGGNLTDWTKLTDIGKIISSEVEVKIPLKSRSLVVLHGPARHSWKHGILREDIRSRRLCCTFRELSSEFLDGKNTKEGQNLIEIADSYCGTVVL